MLCYNHLINPKEIIPTYISSFLEIPFDYIFIQIGVFMAKYSIGIDYGTLSGRAVLVDTSDGREVASAVLE